MKKVLLSAILLIITITLSLAQVPQAFKYQAIARDEAGSILANRNISLRISILSENTNGDAVYSETHTALTNNFGLVNLDIGYGNDPVGQVSDINWGSSNYYLRIEMDESGGKNFKLMGISQLLSVPYALHSGTSGGLTNAGKEPGIPANAWSMFGNSNSNPLLDKLGTTDNVDLVLVTSNIDRVRILSNGDVDIKNNTKIRKDLTVEKNVSLNTISGSTINNGPFTVANLSPTLLSGTLTVDLATDLNSSLNVDGITDLNSAFHVNNNSNSHMTGELLLNGDGTFNQHLLLNNAAFNSTLPSNGALVVHGGAGIGKDLRIGDSLNIHRDLYVHGKSKFNGEVTINGPLKLRDTTSSVNDTTGALTVAGGVGISKQLNVGNGATIKTNTVGGSASNYDHYTLKVEGGRQGIAVKVGDLSSSNSTNFVSFWDNTGKMHGRIRGETTSEAYLDPAYLISSAVFIAKVAKSIYDVSQAGVELAAATASSTACAGLGVCVTAPIPSLIVAATTKQVGAWAQLFISIGERAANETFKAQHIGVSYSSGSADYAEWLLKSNPLESFYPGAIVGVRAGQISLNTNDAEELMVISTNPIVLGNMPEPGRENLYEKVAFMGQVPVNVFGEVKAGDYILPSGDGDGIGIAVSPDNLKPEDYSRIVGMAWSAASGDKINTVNVAVGLNNNDAAKLVAKQESRITELESQLQTLQAQINKTNQLLVKLVPGFELGEGQTDRETVQPKKQAIVQTADVSVANPEDRTIVYFKLTMEHIQDSYIMAENMLKEKGFDLDTNPFFKKMRSEPEYKSKVFAEMLESSNRAIENRARIEAKSGLKVMTY